ncbi:hypothetical protein LLS1_08180 [Leifsonia sp. LS1]|nr:hypothetical protein LLS1_08180 [Leifsonia sp. LS1]
MALSGVVKVTVGVLRKSPSTFTDFEASPAFVFWQVAAAAVLVADGSGAEELQAASPATTRAAVRRESDLRTIEQSAASA